MNQEKYREGLEEFQSEKRSKVAVESMLSFYCSNQKYCRELYQNYINHRNKKYSGFPPTTSKTQFQRTIGNEAILVCTATEIEKYVFISQMSQVAKMSSFLVQSVVYNVFVYKETHIIVHTHQMKIGANFAQETIERALSVFRPKVIVLLGVCYGIDAKTQKVAEVCISDRVDCYRLDIRDAKIEPQFEALHIPNERLIDTLRAAVAWYSPHAEGRSPDSVGTATNLGRFISANSKISNHDVKAHIIQACGQPMPIAGEMEAYGALAANRIIPPQPNRKYLVRNWLVIKSICDWGEMKNELSEDKNENEEIKDSIQLVAMMNSWSIFRFLLEKELLIKG